MLRGWWNGGLVGVGDATDCATSCVPYSRGKKRKWGHPIFATLEIKMVYEVHFLLSPFFFLCPTFFLSSTPDSVYLPSFGEQLGKKVTAEKRSKENWDPVHFFSPGNLEKGKENCVNVLNWRKSALELLALSLFFFKGRINCLRRRSRHCRRLFFSLFFAKLE